MLDDFNINNNDCAVEDDMPTFMNESVAALAGVVGSTPSQMSKSEAKIHHIEKLWWDEVYCNLSDDDFKNKIRINREEPLTRYTFFLISNLVRRVGLKVS